MPRSQPSRSARSLARVAAAVVVTCGAIWLGQGASAERGPDAEATSLTTRLLRPAADAHVSRARPERNYGRAPVLRFGGARGTESVIRFRVGAIDGSIRRATLRLLPARGSRRGVTVRASGRGRWGEQSITYSSAPRARRALARSGPLRRGRWVSLDVTRAVREARSVSLALVSRGRAGVYSRQTGRARAPRLVIEVAPRPASASPLIAAAGDIACDPRSPNRLRGTPGTCRDRATSDLLVQRELAAVLALGDLQYEDGRLSAFREIYDQTWGRLKSITFPAVGNHEYVTRGAAGYFDYFNGRGHHDGRAGARDKGYYSFDVGTWHLIALNSNCEEAGGCGLGSPQETWLRADLAAHSNRCTLAYWHHPRFSSGEQGSSARYERFWEVLYEAGADVVLAGHAHDYERFAPQRADGTRDTERGIRQFVVGTGGKYHYGFEAAEPNSEVRHTGTHGILLMRLHPRGYDWKFVPEPGGRFRDAGSDECR